MKKGFETMTDFEIGLGLAPVTFSATDHRPQSKAKIRNGRAENSCRLDEVDLKNRWPDKWEERMAGLVTVEDFRHVDTRSRIKGGLKLVK